ncbi:ankyrin repeat [Trichoderma arundinaceum]|uniref:Ankyrin repeat n=1 Tax=Trichoderma arundinaceum TaxID=490622 RepID=A0A395NPI5_TRIAR|nr:ankyrin repeat [Trichoderma arundinaceum]
MTPRDEHKAIVVRAVRSHLLSFNYKRDCFTVIPGEYKYAITEYLAIPDLSRLARVSRYFREFVTPRLYHEDSLDERPRAIFWAASVSSREIGLDIIMNVLDLAVEYGGDVNLTHHQSEPFAFYATPLHMAAVRGEIDVVKKLLEHKADPNTLGKDFLHDSRISLEPRTFELKICNNEVAIASRYTKWRPLFVPFVMEHKKMIKLLLESGASPVLAITDHGENESTPEASNINILHILASQEMRQYTDTANVSYFKKFSSCINAPIPRGESPLFIALRHGDEELLKDIIANGGNIETVTEMGRTPLIQAITHYYMARSPEMRKTYQDIIAFFIESCGANVNRHPDPRVTYTPLISAIAAIPSDLKVTIREIRATITPLIDHGADLNDVSSNGLTILHALFRFICTKQQNDTLLELFERFVNQGADINRILPEGYSMLGACIITYNRQPAKFYRLLLKLHASLTPPEVNAVFERWIECPKFRKTLEFNFLDYGAYVTQAAVNSAYRTAIDKDDKLFDLLRCHFPNVTIAETIATEALLHDANHIKRFTFALKFTNFNGGFIHDNGNSLLHSIVDRLERYKKYKGAQAKYDAKAVILRGADLEATDDWKRTPLDRLWELRDNPDCSALRLYLYDLRERRKFLTLAHEAEQISQDEYEQKWRELLDDAL